MRQCSSVTDTWTDRWTLTSYHTCEMYILHLALKIYKTVTNHSPNITGMINVIVFLHGTLLLQILLCERYLDH